MFSGRKDCTSGAAKCRPTTEREALYCVGTHSKKTRTQLAEDMKVNPSTLGAWIDPHGDERMPDDRRNEMLALASDNDAWLKFHAHRLGFVVYDPKSIGTGQTARLVSEFGDLLKAIDAREDGTSPEDAERIEREGTELIAVVHKQIEDAKRAAASAPKAVPRW